MRNRQGGTRRERSGAAAVEMAAVLPLIIALVFGQIESARLGMVSQLLNTAAREGCRVAVINGHTASDVKTRVNSVLSGSGISFSSVTPSPSNWDTAAGGTAITVTLSVPYSQVSWLPAPRFLKNVTVKASATFNSERY
jgi:Flp pilus assembly protein TadG